MPYTIPDTKELIRRSLTQLESSLNQHTPAAEKSFNNVLAVLLGTSLKGLYALATDRARETLALTASAPGLEQLGNEYDIFRVQPIAWRGEALFYLPDGETLYLGTIFIGPRGLRYETIASVTAPSAEPGQGIIVPIACIEAGPSGNLVKDDILTIQTPIAGAGSIAAVTGTTELGTPIEDLENFRQRLLDAERAEGGGGNSSDLRSWAQSVPGVARAYPFSGAPVNSGIDLKPGMRTVYIECTSGIEKNGIPSESLLDQVESALCTNPDTGLSREILGLPADTLFVRPIVRTSMYITIVEMSVSNGNIGAAREHILLALEIFFEHFNPFVQGLDPEFDRRDTVTASVIGQEVQNILDSYSGTAQNILFGTFPGEYLGKYTLKQNEKLKLADVAFRNAS